MKCDFATVRRNWSFNGNRKTVIVESIKTRIFECFRKFCFRAPDAVSGWYFPVMIFALLYEDVNRILGKILIRDRDVI